MNRRDLQELSRARLKEARALLKSGLSDGAYYLAGYAVECALKACISKQTKKFDFPDKRKVDASYSHDLRDLIRVAGLEEERRARATGDAFFRRNWDTTLGWSEHSRYKRHTLESARAFVEAVGNRKSGLLAWIMLHW